MSNGMSPRLRETEKRPTLLSVCTNAQIALLFVTLVSSLALVVNWGGTPDALVEGICAGSATLLLALSIINRKRSR
jgi:hypothetical protein